MALTGCAKGGRLATPLRGDGWTWAGPNAVMGYAIRREARAGNASFGTTHAAPKVSACVPRRGWRSAAPRSSALSRSAGRWGGGRFHCWPGQAACSWDLGGLAGCLWEFGRLFDWSGERRLAGGGRPWDSRLAGGHVRGGQRPVHPPVRRSARGSRSSSGRPAGEGRHIRRGRGAYSPRGLRPGGRAVESLCSPHEGQAEGWGARSEERRVGKECSEPCRSRWSPYH